MPQHVTLQEGLFGILDLILANLTTELHLFGNNFVPTPTSVEADFVEPVFPGYAPINGFLWDTCPFGVDGLGRVWKTQVGMNWGATAAPMTPVLVYGWYFTFNKSLIVPNPMSRVLWARRFDAPISIGAIGDHVTFDFKTLFGDIP